MNHLTHNIKSLFRLALVTEELFLHVLQNTVAKSRNTQTFDSLCFDLLRLVKKVQGSLR